MRLTDPADLGPCGFPRARLIAYRDGTLRGARLEITEAHVAACAMCRDFLHELDLVDRMLRTATPFVDDPEARAAIKARIAEMPAPRADPPRRSPFTRGQLTLVVAALLGLLVISVTVPGAIEGGSSFTRFFSRERGQQRVYPEGYGSGTPIILPTVTSGVATLPLGLVPTGPVSVDETSTRQGFRNPDGLAVSVTADRSGTTVLFPPRDNSRQRIVAVDGREVLVGLYSEDDWIIDLMWIDGETVYDVLILEQPPGGLRLPQALELARAVMDEWRPMLDREELEGNP